MVVHCQVSIGRGAGMSRVCVGVAFSQAQRTYFPTQDGDSYHDRLSTTVSTMDAYAGT